MHTCLKKLILALEDKWRYQMQKQDNNDDQKLWLKNESTITRIIPN